MLFRDPITSAQNPRIKNFAHLQKARERREQNVFIVEGDKEYCRAIEFEYQFTSIFVCFDLISEAYFEALSSEMNSNAEVFPVSKDVFDKIAYREGSGGIIALARPKSHTLADLKLPQNPLLLILEAVEKPGNLGAILRTADAAGVDAVIVCDPQTDIYNPNVVRSSIGCLFSVPLAVCNSDEAIAWMKSQHIAIYCTYLKAAVPYTEVDFAKPSAIVMGTESEGITPKWVAAADRNIIIPMQGSADSMNVSTSAAVVVFEACRQRNFEKSV
jgi:TrmH family RNA methyltransferase